MITEEEQTIRALRTAMAVEVRGHHLDPQIAITALSQAPVAPRSQRRRVLQYAAMAASVIVVITVALIYATTGSGSKSDRPLGPPAGCTGTVITSALPAWARSGFSRDAYVQPHVTGVNDDIIGVLFANPLHAPPAKDHANKILWVTKDHSGGPLKITANVAGSTRTVTRMVADGPGPSIINMPTPGCWQMTLIWPGHHDAIALPYAK